MTYQNPRLVLFPLTTEVSQDGHLTIGGCDTVGLARDFGTPLYLFDEDTLRRKCAEFRQGFGRHYPDSLVIYAAKAFINRALAKLLAEEGMGLDVVSLGEMGIARSVSFPPDRIYFHGNNKSPEELRTAVESGIGRIVVDNAHELRLLEGVCREQKRKADILLRLTPGVDPHTHQYIATGNIDSKFGFPLSQAEEAVKQSLGSSSLNLVGLHFHLGSLLFSTEPYETAIGIVLGFAAEMKKKYGFALKELDVGGGVAIQYTVDSPAPPVEDYARVIASRLREGCQKSGLPLPKLIVEPGRSVVGQAGVALYTIGAIKDIPGVRCYVSVDGGMADNIRPAIYGSRYEAVLANKVRAPEADQVTIAGRFCESGDILIKDINLPAVAAGDILAVPDCGAYCLAMASNYNASFKPAIVMVRQGKPRLIRRRETVADLTRCDLL